MPGWTANRAIACAFWGLVAALTVLSVRSHVEAGLSPNAELVSAYPLPADPQAREQRRHQMELLAARQATWSRSELAEQARRSRLRPDDIPAPPPPPAEGIGRLHSIAVHASADPL